MIVSQIFVRCGPKKRLALIPVEHDPEQHSSEEYINGKPEDLYKMQ
ncbi:hypothetical protein DSUL_150097 [Desulfovibrionales bacterium]